MYKLIGPLVLLAVLAACVDQELIDEVEVKCDTWINTANTCVESLGGTESLDLAQCDEINDAAKTSTNSDLEAAIVLLDCQIAAYDTDCSTTAGAEAALDEAQICLAAAQ